MLKNGKIGFLLGTFFGAILGSTSTILVVKKLKKIAEKEYNLAESEAVNEVREYYREKLERLKDIHKPCDYTAVKSDKNIEIKEEKIEPAITKPVVTNPKILYQDRLAKEEAEAERKKKQFDYSQVSKAKYTDLKEEYEREDPVIDENQLPHLITQENYQHTGGYVKEEVIYYEQNGIFADMNDEIVDHLDEQYFGLDTLSLFGTKGASLDGKNSLYELYVRDETLHIDYHIIYNGTEDFDHLGDCR